MIGFPAVHDALLNYDYVSSFELTKLIIRHSAGTSGSRKSVFHLYMFIFKQQEKEVDIETEDSQETREKLRRKLEHVMSTANISRATHTHRLSCKWTDIEFSESHVSSFSVKNHIEFCTANWDKQWTASHWTLYYL